MDLPVACTAKSDEIFFDIPSQLAARLHVMDLEIVATSASLAAPAITLNNSLTKPPIRIPVQAKPGSFWDWWIHEAFGIRSKNSWR